MMQKNDPATVGQTEKRKRRNDGILALVLLLFFALAGGLFYFLRGEGDYISVTADGKTYGPYPLNSDITVELVTGEMEEGRNLLVIRDGKAWVAEANCPDGICAAHKPICRDGESIVCLPHRVAVVVHASEDGEADIIA